MRERARVRWSNPEEHTKSSMAVKLGYENKRRNEKSIVICLECKKEFHPGQYNQVYCSPKCGEIKRTKLVREYTLRTWENNRKVRYKNIFKRPHPSNNLCEVCQEKLERGYGYHHWKIEDDIAYGIWVCFSCHRKIECFETPNFELVIKKYKKLKKKADKEINEMLIKW